MPIIIGQTGARAAFLWIVVRIGLAGLGSAIPGFRETSAGGVQQALAIQPATAVLVALLVAALVLADARALRERAFFANLGIGLNVVAAYSIATVLVLESLAAVALRLA